jgi:predicted RNA binding protein YcfA (HicA-like mRNA interferase family)
MNLKLPRITAKELMSILTKLGFKLVRSSGSHHILRNKKGIRVTVPVHAGKIIHPKILKRIITDIDISVVEFEKLISK